MLNVKTRRAAHSLIQLIRRLDLGLGAAAVPGEGLGAAAVPGEGSRLM
jgi:hypothetical protein